MKQSKGGPFGQNGDHTGKFDHGLALQYSDEKPLSISKTLMNEMRKNVSIKDPKGYLKSGNTGDQFGGG